MRPPEPTRPVVARDRSRLPGRRRRRARGRLLAGVVGLAGVLLAVLPTSGPSAGSTISGDKNKINRLEQKIAAQGSVVESLVNKEGRVSAQLAVIKADITREQGFLAADRRKERAAAARLRTAAIEAYINDASGNSSALDTIIDSKNVATFPEQQAYLGFASGNLNSAVNTLQQDQYLINRTEATLNAEEAQTAATLQELGSAQAAAQTAVNADQAILKGVNGNLLQLVTAAEERREQAQQRAEEEALAAAAAQQQAQSTATTPPPTAQPTAGSYSNPLRGISGLGAERIDQGVDYRGFGPIYAIGDGTILSTYNGGWPGGTFIAYRLTDGPAAGLVVYAAEDIEPRVSVGESVNSDTVLGTVYEGSDGIEIGWSNPAADGETMAATYGQYYGGNSTAFGYNFDQLLSSLGSPGGQLQGAVSGGVPVSWPNW